MIKHSLRGPVPIIVGALVLSLAGAAWGAEQAGARIKERVFLELEAPAEARVNEEVPVTARFYTDWLDIEKLEVWDAPTDTYIAGNFASAGSTVVSREGSKYAVIEFRKKLVFTEPGDFRYGPVSARCDITARKAGLLNDNEAFYESYLRGRKSRQLTVESRQVDIKVLPAAAPEAAIVKEQPPAEAEPAEEEKEKPRRELVGVKASPGRFGEGDPHFYRSRRFFLVEIGPLLLLLISVLAERRIRLLRSDTPYTRWLRASRLSAENMEKAASLMRKKDVKGFYIQVFRTMQRYIGARFSVLPEGITEDIADQKIRPVIGDDEVAEEIKKIFRECHLVRYGMLEPGEKDMENTFSGMRSVLSVLNDKKDI